MTPTGIEPVLPPWKGDVLTAWPRSLILLSFGTAAPLFFFCSSSPSRARTCNNSVNSRVLYHWAIEDYVLQVVPSKPNTEIFLHIFCKLVWLILWSFISYWIVFFHTLIISRWFLFCNRLRLLPGGKITSHFRGPLLVAKDKPSTY